MHWPWPQAPLTPQCLGPSLRNNNLYALKFDPPHLAGMRRWSLSKYQIFFSLHHLQCIQYVISIPYMMCMDITWLKLHACLIAIIFGLNRTVEGCKKKFNILYKLYNKDNLANEISGSKRYAYKFYDYVDQ